MKSKLLLLISAGIFSFQTFSQTLFDIFKLLPKESVLNLSSSDRNTMIQNHKKGITQDGVAFDIVDEKNGYLSIPGDHRWEMCYWQIGSKKLVAVYDQKCAPICTIDHFNFFSYENGKISKLDNATIIPGFNSIYKDFFIKDVKATEKELEKKDIMFTMLYELPQKGKNIIVHFGVEADKETYKPYFKGNTMVLKWNNGKFEKQPIKWETFQARM